MKCINNDFCHKGFKYQIGWNTDTIEFNPFGSCKAGGLYFTTSDFIHEFLEFGSNIAIIELCQDAEFYIDPAKNKYKTNKFIITELLPQTEEICKLAVQQNGMALQYVKEQTEELCKLAVQQNEFRYSY
jgi:hypothetical protein